MESVGVVLSPLPSYDKAKHSKIDPPTVTGIYLGIDRHRGGGGIDDVIKSCYVYLPEQQRFTTLNFHDCTFFEDEFPTIGTAIARLLPQRFLLGSPTASMTPPSAECLAACLVQRSWRSRAELSAIDSTPSSSPRASAARNVSPPHGVLL